MYRCRWTRGGWSAEQAQRSHRQWWSASSLLCTSQTEYTHTGNQCIHCHTFHRAQATQITLKKEYKWIYMQTMSESKYTLLYYTETEIQLSFSNLQGRRVNRDFMSYEEMFLSSNPCVVLNLFYTLNNLANLKVIVKTHIHCLLSFISWTLRPGMSGCDEAWASSCVGLAFMDFCTLWISAGHPSLFDFRSNHTRCVNCQVLLRATK